MREDKAAKVGAVISTLFLGGVAYAVAVTFINVFADKLSALFNAVIAML